MEQKYHPILERPWEYSLDEIHWSESSEGGGTFLDIILSKGEIIRRLRFVNPQKIKIDLSGGYPQSCGEMVILDIRDYGWEGLGVEIAEGGASGSPITLYAREVIDLDNVFSGRAV